MDEREEFCGAGPRAPEVLEQMGIEDADLHDGRMLADAVYCAGYRKVEAGS